MIAHQKTETHININYMSVAIIIIAKAIAKRVVWSGRFTVAKKKKEKRESRKMQCNADGDDDGSDGWNALRTLF